LVKRRCTFTSSVVNAEQRGDQKHTQEWDERSMSKTSKQNITPLMCLAYNFSNMTTEVQLIHVNKNTLQ